MSLAAYKTTIRQTETPRQIERRIMARITAQIAAHQADFDGTSDTGRRLDLLANKLRPALTDNLTLWMAFKTDLLDPQNTLSAEIRAGLLSLGYFVERQTAKVFAGEANVAALVDVNNSIMKALAGQAEEPA